MRSTVRDAARRAYHNTSRATVKKTDDTHLLQEIDLELVKDEKKTGVERFQQYGITAVPLPEDKDGKKSAESVVLFVNGSRSHGIIISVDDRRYRLKKLKDGEVALYDDQGHQVHITRDGIVLSAPQGKKIVTQIMSGSDRPKDQAASGSSSQTAADYGQIAQATQTVHASFTLTKDSFTVKHPGTIEHQIADANGNVKSSVKMTTDGIELKGGTISNQATQRFETVGKTYLGLDNKNEDGVINDVTGDLPAKQVWVKPL